MTNRNLQLQQFKNLSISKLALKKTPFLARYPFLFMLPAAFLPLHKLYHNGEKQEEIPCIINFLHVPVDEIIGCPLGLME